MCHRLELRLPARPDSVSGGRRRVADALQGWGVSEPDPAFARHDDVLLLTSELLANAVRVANSPVVLRIEAHHDSIKVDVIDDSPLPALRQPADGRSSSGRGLLIVDAVADEWGQRPYDGATKEVWGIVNVQPGSALGHGCLL